MDSPLVSVVMPAYNAAAFIAESIESVLHQTYTNWELLIVDDGSTDDTKKIVESFCAKDERIKYSWQQNGKQGKARNLALKHAKGNCIAFLDADDVWLTKKLEVQIKLLEEKKADLVFSNGFVFKANISDGIAYKNAGKGYINGRAGLSILLDQNSIPILTVLVKSEAINKVNGFTEKLSIQNAEDYHLWLKLLMNGYTFFGSDLELAGYRLHSSSSSSADKLGVPCVIEAFEDLKKQYKQYRELINTYQKKWFSRYHASTNTWNKKDYQSLIRKNCIYLKKAYLVFVFQVVYFLGGVNITRKMMNKLVNN
jgi:teichuronic acid biosynthesis glycosyltransferase TuaG